MLLYCVPLVRDWKIFVFREVQRSECGFRNLFFVFSECYPRQAQPAVVDRWRLQPNNRFSFADSNYRRAESCVVPLLEHWPDKRTTETSQSHKQTKLPLIRSLSSPEHHQSLPFVHEPLATRLAHHIHHTHRYPIHSRRRESPDRKGHSRKTYTTTNISHTYINDGGHNSESHAN